MLIKSKITFPVKKGVLNKVAVNKKSVGVLVEARKHIVKSDLKSIEDYGNPFDIQRLLFTRI